MTSARTIESALARTLLVAVLVSAGLLIGGCAARQDPAPVGAPGDGGPSAAIQEDQMAAANALLEQQRYAEAGAEFERLAAQAQGAEAAQLELDAAGAYVAAGDLESARALLGRQPTLAPGNPLSDNRSLVMAEVALAEGRPGDALAIVPDYLSNATGGRTRLGLAHARVRAHESLGEHVESARARADLDALLARAGAADALSPALWRERSQLEAAGAGESLEVSNRQRLWTSLGAASVAELEAARGTPPDSFSGWIELAENSRPVMTDAPALRAMLAFWSQRYPEHPAALQIVPELLDASARAGKPPSRIAALLPLSGPFEAAGSAVKEGFLGAWNNDDSSLRPQLDVLDTMTRDVVSLYRGAVEQGADFVVGPLRKPLVRAMVDSGAPSVPTLALNEASAEATPDAGPGFDAQAPDASASADSLNEAVAQDAPEAAADAGAQEEASVESAPLAALYTFTLAPEAEARRVADHAYAAGHRGAAVLAPEGVWGDRMSSAFAERWQEIGGTVVAEQRYDANESDFGSPVETLLQVKQSENRARQLRGVVRRYFAFQPNYRQDMDFIFMPAFPVEARLLKPHLSYFAASRVPVIATSHVYAGEPNTGADLDLERIRFGGMPIVLLPTPSEQEMLARIGASTSENPADYARLFAFGADAYALAKRVQAMSVTEGAAYQGRSGALTVTAQGEVQRGLTWATFVDGYPLVDGQTRPDPASDPAVESPTAQDQPSPPAQDQPPPPPPAPDQPPPDGGAGTGGTSASARRGEPRLDLDAQPRWPALAASSIPPH